METQTNEGSARPFAAVRIEADETDSIANLAAALAAAQGEMKAAAKDSKNPHFNSRYADLASVWEACREPLSRHGLAVMQRWSTVPEGVLLTTMLVHKSGEWVRDRAVIPVAQKTAQAYGSALTYARRYALAALVGVAADDDDGNEASQGARQEPQRQAQQRQQPKREEAKAEQKPEPKPEQAKADAAPASSNGKVTTQGDAATALRARVTRLWKAMGAAGYTKDGFRTWAKGLLGVDKSSVDWSEAELEKLETEAHKLAAEEKPAAEKKPENDVPF